MTATGFELRFVLLDLEKAIDLVRIEVVCFALKFQDVLKYLANGVMSLYQGIKTAISVEGKLFAFNQ